jgi:phosphohistidine phosphatase
MYFVQHGLAVAKEIDPERPLSEAGRREVEHVADRLRMAGVAVKAIYHSGKPRAEQTAGLFAEQVGFGPIAERSGMKPNDRVADFADTLQEEIMYVGHLPHMGRLVSLLTAGDEEAGVVRFSNGGVVCVERDESGFHIAWYLTPAMCMERDA